MASFSRRSLLTRLSLLPASGLLIWSSRAEATHYAAKLCSSCSFGSKKDDCAKCGKWMASTKIPARLCSDCGFGSKGDNCVKCGKWVGSSHEMAHICSNCGFGSKKDNCVKCGKWAP